MPHLPLSDAQCAPAPARRLGLPALPADGRLRSLPQLIEQYIPDLHRLPAFVLALGQVEWSCEAECFASLAQALADLYSIQPSLVAAAGSSGDVASSAGTRAEQAGGEAEQAAAATPSEPAPAASGRAAKQHAWVVQHVVFPALRLFLTPSRQRASDGSFVELTRLESLYRVFERC